MNDESKRIGKEVTAVRFNVKSPVSAMISY
jgi:hypothetical protein